MHRRLLGDRRIFRENRGRTKPYPFFRVSLASPSLLEVILARGPARCVMLQPMYLASFHTASPMLPPQGLCLCYFIILEHHFYLICLYISFISQGKTQVLFLRKSFLGFFQVPKYSSSHSVYHLQFSNLGYESLVSQKVKNLPALQETLVQSLGWEDPLQEVMATHSTMLAWGLSWIEEPGGLQSMGSQRVRHD